MVSLSPLDPTSLQIYWTTDHIYHGSLCYQAYHIEVQEFGRGRKSWSQWSSLVSCADVVQLGSVEEMGSTRNYTCHRDMQDIDCGKR